MPSDIDVALRLYELLRDAAPVDDEYDIELALLEQMVKDFENAIRYAESDERERRGQEAIDAALGLRRSIMALVASPGAQG